MIAIYRSKRMLIVSSLLVGFAPFVSLAASSQGKDAQAVGLGQAANSSESATTKTPSRSLRRSSLPILMSLPAELTFRRDTDTKTETIFEKNTGSKPLLRGRIDI